MIVDVVVEKGRWLHLDHASPHAPVATQFEYINK